MSEENEMNNILDELEYSSRRYEEQWVSSCAIDRVRQERLFAAIDDLIHRFDDAKLLIADDSYTAEQALAMTEKQARRVGILRNELVKTMSNETKISHSPKPTGWQPIETAPKDSTRILGLMPNGKTQAIVRWGGGTWEDDNRLCLDPKRWMELPAPPEKL